MEKPTVNNGAYGEGEGIRPVIKMRHPVTVSVGMYGINLMTVVFGNCPVLPSPQAPTDQAMKLLLAAVN